jgi:hypothetical protein
VQPAYDQSYYGGGYEDPYSAYADPYGGAYDYAGYDYSGYDASAYAGEFTGGQHQEIPIGPHVRACECVCWGRGKEGV